jgi:hypothetical protein
MRFTRSKLANSNIPSFFAIFSYSSGSHPCYNPFEIQIIPSPFPATKARDAQGEHF